MAQQLEVPQQRPSLTEALYRGLVLLQPPERNVNKLMWWICWRELVLRDISCVFEGFVLSLFYFGRVNRFHLPYILRHPLLTLNVCLLSVIIVE